MLSPSAAARVLKLNPFLHLAGVLLALPLLGAIMNALYVPDGDTASGARPVGEGIGLLLALGLAMVWVGAFLMHIGVFAAANYQWTGARTEERAGRIWLRWTATVTTVWSVVFLIINNVEDDFIRLNDRAWSILVATLVPAVWIAAVLSWVQMALRRRNPQPAAAQA